MCKSLKELVDKRHQAHANGNRQEAKQAQKELDKAIKTAKDEYRQKVEDKFVSGDLRKACVSNGIGRTTHQFKSRRNTRLSFPCLYCVAHLRTLPLP